MRPLLRRSRTSWLRYSPARPAPPDSSAALPPRPAATPASNQRTSRPHLRRNIRDRRRNLLADLAADRLVRVLDHHPDDRLRPARPEKYPTLFPEPTLGFQDHSFHGLASSDRHSRARSPDGDVYEGLWVDLHHLRELREGFTCPCHHVQERERRHEPIPGLRILREDHMP